ncbi:MAG TPA: DUF4234 domain-containing protein [Firmicutes bacterium]|nr:DUF4234 domain-containing protein [Bacillota bacterium]
MVLYGVTYVIALLRMAAAFPYGLEVTTFLRILCQNVLQWLVGCFACLWLAFPQGRQKPVFVAEDMADGADYLPPEAFCRMSSHVLLLIFTFGTWSLIWIYRTTKYVNCLRSMPRRSPVAQLLLCMFLPFYQIYWSYQSGKRIDRLGLQRGIGHELATVCIVCGFLPPWRGISSCRIR